MQLPLFNMKIHNSKKMSDTCKAKGYIIFVTMYDQYNHGDKDGHETTSPSAPTPF